MSKYADAIRLVRNSVGAFRDPVERRRRRISFDLARKLDFTVQVGPLKGFRVAQNPSWGRGDLAGMLLGLYEAPVLSKLVELSEKFCAFIDIGAADGYYGVGLVKSDIYQTSYCFEMSSRSQRSLAALAAEVGVVDRVKIAGRADSGLVVDALNALGDGGGAAILIDIEGGEYDLLNSETLFKLAGCAIIVEMHDVGPQTAIFELELKAHAEPWFIVSQLKSAGKNPHALEQLQSLSETDKWLICSEARSRSQHWLIFEPRSLA